MNNSAEVYSDKKLELKDITPKCFIMALFIRGDGKRFLLGDGYYEFLESQLHFAGNEFENTVIEVQGGDGAFLAGQVRRSSTQEFNGYIGDATVKKSIVEQKRNEFISFFQKNYYYKVVYIYPDGTAKMRQKGYIVDAPEVQEIWQIHPEYHVALNFEDVNYYSYSEDDDGGEVFDKKFILYPDNGSVEAGGLVWAETVYDNENIRADGVYWDEIGAVWEVAEGGAIYDNIIKVNTTTPVNPRITIAGETINPVIANTTTGQTIRYDGSISASQTLVIDLSAKTALLNGVNVLNKLSGDWLELVNGDNVMSYTTTGAGKPATIEWQEILG